MTEKQYRLNKWGTRLLKNNRPLFDWTNEADDIVDFLNSLNEENEQLKQQNILLMQQVDKLQRYIKELEYDNKRQNKQLDIFRDILKKE